MPVVAEVGFGNRKVQDIWATSRHRKLMPNFSFLISGFIPYASGTKTYDIDNVAVIAITTVLFANGKRESYHFSHVHARIEYRVAQK